MNVSFFFPFIYFLFSAASGSNLFLISENDKYGFINSKGDVVIQPQFLSAREFTEGFAAVRNGGLWGYINSKGQFQISAQFEYAQPFKDGFAVVYKDAKPFYINKAGKQPFPTGYRTLGDFDKGRAEVTTYTKKYGYINTDGELILDTVYKFIHPFSEGLAVVEGIDDSTSSNDNIGVVDTTGRIIVPFGRFVKISDFNDGYAQVDTKEKEGDEDGETAQSGFINRRDEIVFLRYNKNNSWIDGDLKNGVARINLYKYWIPDRKGILYSGDKSYVGYINLQEKIILDDTTIVNATPFSEGRAFIGRKFEDYYLIDTNGKRISNNSFTRVSERGFSKGVAFVQKNYKWGIINREGDFIVPPKFDDVEENILAGDCFAFSEQIKNKLGHYETRYGIASLEGRILIKPVLEDYDRRGFRDGIIHGQVNSKLVYLDTLGNVVWEAGESKEAALSDLNIDYMNRGYFYASQSSDHKDYNGWGGSTNKPKITTTNGSGKLIVVSIDTTQKQIFDKRYNGYLLSIINTSTKAISFNAEDSRINLRLQAVNNDGEWQDIEYLPHSWCGNSYHTVELKSKEGWSFNIPKYSGDIKTKIRAELVFIDPSEKSKSRDRKEIKVYSNEVYASVNLGQYWRKLEYFPQGLMDPYNE